MSVPTNLLMVLSVKELRYKEHTNHGNKRGSRNEHLASWKSNMLSASKQSKESHTENEWI